MGKIFESLLRTRIPPDIAIERQEPAFAGFFCYADAGKAGIEQGGFGS
jgi:hypothetical protein